MCLNTTLAAAFGVSVFLLSGIVFASHRNLWFLCCKYPSLSLLLPFHIPSALLTPSFFFHKVCSFGHFFHPSLFFFLLSQPSILLLQYGFGPIPSLLPIGLSWFFWWKKSGRMKKWAPEQHSPLAWVHCPHLFCIVIPLLFSSDSYKPCLVISCSFCILPTPSSPQYDPGCEFLCPQHSTRIKLFAHASFCCSGIAKKKSSPAVFYFGQKKCFSTSLCLDKNAREEFAQLWLQPPTPVPSSCCWCPFASSFSSSWLCQASPAFEPHCTLRHRKFTAPGTENICLPTNMYTGTRLHLQMCAYYFFPCVHMHIYIYILAWKQVTSRFSLFLSTGHVSRHFGSSGMADQFYFLVSNLFSEKNYTFACEYVCLHHIDLTVANFSKPFSCPVSQSLHFLRQSLAFHTCWQTREAPNPASAGKVRFKNKFFLKI